MSDPDKRPIQGWFFDKKPYGVVGSWRSEPHGTAKGAKMQLPNIEAQANRGGRPLSQYLYAPESLLTPLEAAAILSLSHKTLANWRCFGKGPAFIGVGRIRYRYADLLNFLEKNRRNSTSESD